MSRQDAAIKAFVLTDPVGVAELLSRETAPEGGCLLWTGRLWANGAGSVSIPGPDGRGVPVSAHRLAYALYRGVDALPPGTVSLGRNGPCVAQLCLVKACVASAHLARIRKAQIGYVPLDPIGWVLPDEPRYLAENRWRALAPSTFL